MSLQDFNDAQSEFWEAVGKQDIGAAQIALDRMQEASRDILYIDGVQRELDLAERAFRAM